MPLTAKEMIRLLEKNGFVCVRSNGSHYIYRNAQTGKQTIVPFHSRDLKPGTERKILELAGITKK